MSFDKFDNRIKEAAENQSVAFDERSWDRMYHMLNEHLPEEKKDRRRFFFFLLLGALVLGGGSIFLLTGKRNDGAASNHIGATIDPVQSKIPEKTTQVSGDDKTNNTIINNDGNVSTTATNDQAEVINSTLPVVNNKSTTAKKQHDNPVAVFRTTPGTLSNNTSGSTVQNNTTNISKTDPNDQVITKSQPDLLTSTASSAKDMTKEDVTAPVEEIEEKVKNEEQVLSPTQEPPKHSAKKIFPLAITASAGPDLSMVRMNNTGKIMLAYGAGLSYDISPRFSIRAGFYVSRKIYSAKPEDYDPPKEFWNYYPNLKNIDADCKIYEIPVIVDYFIGKKKNISLSAGVSSLIMKQEDYAYTYRPPYTPQYITYSRSHRNENDHFFSIVHLSAGYNYPISKRVALRAEPYIKLPVSGIGYGKIKLNSAGILMTVAVKPFTSSK